MCSIFGGGGGGAPPPDQPNWGQIQYDQDRVKDAENAKNDRVNLYNQRLAEVMGRAPTIAANIAAQMGINPGTPQFQGIIQQITSDMGAKIPKDQDTGVDPNSYFTSDAFTQQFGDAQSRARTANTAQVRNSFAPGSESTLLPDNMIDSIVNNILGEQRGLADTTLGYQSKRGLLTPQGAEQAQKGLAGQSSAAKSTLSNLAKGVLDKDRSGINDIVGDAGTAANSWMLGNDAFDVNPFKQRVNDTVGRDTANLEGDVRSSLGNTQLFDLPTIVAQAGQAQGAQNLTPGSEAGAGIPGARKKDGAGRGLGSSGGF